MEEREEFSSNGIFNISLEKFKDLIDLKISLDEIYVLEQLSKGLNVESIKCARVEAIIQTLQRKGYLLSGQSVSVSGHSLLNCMRVASSAKEAIAQRRAAQESDFERWWKTYPSTDIFEHKGKKFIGTRGFRVKKEECRMKFNRILEEGEHSVEDLIRALEYEVMIKKETSVQEGDNKMRYLQSTLPYLNQRTFENFVEISKHPLRITATSGTDI